MAIVKSSHALLVLLAVILSSCSKVLIKEPSTQASAIFEDTWSFLDKNYALFESKAINWDSVHKVYSQKITNDITNEALFETLANMLSTLKDGHVALSNGAITRNYTGFYSFYSNNYNESTLYKTYLLDYKRTGPLVYTQVNGVGYLHIETFKTNFTAAALDSILTSMKGVKGIIVDLRNNEGGDLNLAYLVISRFIAEAKLVKYEVSKNGTGHASFDAPSAVTIKPGGQTFTAPVRVLTNRRCFSACNDLALFFSELPRVKIYGDQTGGGGGIPFNYILSNAWLLQYTGTKTLSVAGLSIESGIQPDVKINISTLDDFNGKDPILEAAYNSLQ